MALLEIRNLQLEFGRGAGALRALDGVSLSIETGETLCLVGESGSGKSVTALSVARLVPAPPARYVGGEVLVEGRDVLKMSAKELRAIRGGVVSYVFQEPGASLNPVLRIGKQIQESLQLHRPDTASNEEVVRLLKLVGIPAPETRAGSYPHELSGGMQQRVMIAMAIASHPRLLVADRDANALVLRTLDGESTTLRPSEIDSLQPTGRSLMPEGLLDGLSDQQLRDLFAYLRSSQPMTK